MSDAEPLLVRYQYPLIPMLLLFMTGALVASGLPIPKLFWFCWLVIWVMAAIASVGLSRQYFMVRWYLWVLTFVFGGAWFAQFHFEPGSEDISRWAGQQQAVISGVLSNIGPSENQWVVEAETLGEKHAKGRFLLRFPRNESRIPTLEIGQYVTLSGQLSLPRTATYPGGFNYRAYLQQQKMTAILTARQVTVEATAGVSPWLSILKTAAHLRQRICNHFKQNLPATEAALLASIVLGDHAVGLENDIKMRFVRSGLVHVLAASGFNVGLIGAFFLFLGRWLRLPLRVSLLGAMAGVGIYALLTGLPPSVQRAGMMLELAFILKFFQRELTPLMLLCVTGAILTFFEPMVITMLGFQLSFLSTLGLMMMIKPLQEWLGFYISPWLAGLLLVPLVAQLWVIPLILYTFNQVQLMSLPANLVALPLVAVLTYAGFLLGGLSLIAPWLTGGVIHALGFLCTLLHGVAGFFGNSAASLWMLPSPSLSGVILLFGMILLVAYGLHFPHLLPVKKLSFCLLLGVLLIILPVGLDKWQAQHQMRLVWLPDGNGSGSQIIHMPNNTVVLNISDLNPYNSRDIQAYLRRNGIARIAMLSLVSSRVRHLEGLVSLAQTIPVQQIVSPELDVASARNQLADFALKNRVPVLTVSSTSLVQGRHLNAVFMSLSQAETMQRFDIGGGCIATHWGEKSLVQSPFQQMAEGCRLVQDTQSAQRPTVVLSDYRQPITLAGFQQFVLTRDRIHMPQALLTP
jgi:competence protein ComEC